MHKPIKDGTRIYLDSVLLNDIFRRTSADEIKLLLRTIIHDQSKPLSPLEFLNKEFNIKNPETLIGFICDRRACDTCSYPNCKYTTDIKHAENFVLTKIGNYEEKER